MQDKVGDYACFQKLYLHNFPLQNRSPRDSRAGSSGTVSPTSSLASSHDDSPFIGSSSAAPNNTRRVSEPNVKCSVMVVEPTCYKCKARANVAHA